MSWTQVVIAALVIAPFAALFAAGLNDDCRNVDCPCKWRLYCECHDRLHCPNIDELIAAGLATVVPPAAAVGQVVEPDHIPPLIIPGQVVRRSDAEPKRRLELESSIRPNPGT
jgi:hypothetical protein